MQLAQPGQQQQHQQDRVSAAVRALRTSCMAEEQQQACQTLFETSSSPEGREEVVLKGGVGALVNVLRVSPSSPPEGLLPLACQVLQVFCADERWLPAVTSSGCLSALLGSLQLHGHSEAATVESLKLLQGLALETESRSGARQEEAETSVQRLMQQHRASEAVQFAGCAVLGNLAAEPGPREHHRRSMMVMIEAMRGHPECLAVQEEATHGLYNIVASSDEMVTSLSDLGSHEVLRTALARFPGFSANEDAEVLLQLLDGAAPPA